MANTSENDDDMTGRIDGSILDRIGRTPLVRLRRMVGAGAATAVAKC
jgi:hypothetical protein